jgi:hypothetical protein
MPLPSVPIGIDDFRKLRERGLLYVDKSHLIREVLDPEGIEVLLLPRPRRFGKSLGLSMLRWFFEKQEQDLSHLFKDLAIWRAGDAYRQHFQRYPVIYVNFKDIRPTTFELFWDEIREQIRDLFKYHRVVLDSGTLDEVAAQRYRAILDGSAPVVLYRRALLDLSGYLHHHYGEKVIILIDEYDSPIHAGYLNDYTEKVLDFFRSFFGAGLKGNQHLYKAVLTGILRVARESIFSGLNNLAVYTLLRSEFATCFGLTEAEVENDLLVRAGRANALAEVQHWYKGYLFGGHVMYNPWSVMCFLADAEGKARAHWLSTSDNELIKRLLKQHAVQLQPFFSELLSGGSIEQVIDENVVLSDLSSSSYKTEALWSLLVFFGYLRAEECTQPLERTQPFMTRPIYRLTIPNAEVRLVYTETFREWIELSLHSHGGNLRALVDALLNGRAAALEEQLTVLVKNLMSSHDAGSKNPESFYHGFVLGLLAVLEPRHTVRSNRESGRGRPDVMIYPVHRGQPGVLMELKVARTDRKSLDQVLEEALIQIQEKGYAAELEASGAAPVYAYAVAFDGKEVRVRMLEGE